MRLPACFIGHERSSGDSEFLRHSCSLPRHCSTRRKNLLHGWSGSALMASNQWVYRRFPHGHLRRKREECWLLPTIPADNTSRQFFIPLLDVAEFHRRPNGQCRVPRRGDYPGTDRRAAVGAGRLARPAGWGRHVAPPMARLSTVGANGGPPLGGRRGRLPMPWGQNGGPMEVLTTS